jgi:hypothetical protein
MWRGGAHGFSIWVQTRTHVLQSISAHYNRFEVPRVPIHMYRTALPDRRS